MSKRKNNVAGFKASSNVGVSKRPYSSTFTSQTSSTAMSHSSMNSKNAIKMDSLHGTNNKY